MTPAHPARQKRARCASPFTNRAHPSLARGCPRRHTSLARLRAPISLRTAIGLRRSAPFASAQARASAAASPRWPCASRAPLLGSSHGALARGCHFGPARVSRHPPCPRVLRVKRCYARPLASIALRAGRRAQPRFARPPRSASANAFASLSPPRLYTAHSSSPVRVRRRCEFASILPLLPPIPPRHQQHASGEKAWRLGAAPLPALPPCTSPP